MNEMNDLLSALTPPQQKAIHLLRLALGAYNSHDDTGLFQGMTRYAVLTERVKIAAVQARDLPGFWSCLLRKMLWPISPKRMDSLLLAALRDPEPASVLRVLALEAPYCVMLARHLHDTDKQAHRAFLGDDESPADAPAVPFDDLAEVCP